MNEFLLNRNDGFSWISNEDTFIKGFFFDHCNQYYEGDDMLEYFTNINNKNEFLEKVKTINGSFTIIKHAKDTVWLASDTSRIFPVFYAFTTAGVCFSDSALTLNKHLKLSVIDAEAEQEFSACLHTTKNKTLFKNIYQNQSNELLTFSKNSISSTSFFYSYATNTFFKDSYSILKEKAIVAMDNSFKRFITSLNNRPVVLPLSGGFDSRFIAVMLKKHDYKNVFCFTYGKKGNKEIENSQATAKQLGFDWMFIEYNKTLIDGFIDSKTFKDYAHYTGNFCSMPFLQEYFAVKYLSDHNIVPQNAVFVPGHCGDFLGGSQFLDVFPKEIDPKNIAQLIYNKRYSHTSKTTSIFKETGLSQIKTFLNQLDQNKTNGHSIFENYDLKELFTKFLFNSANVYHFFGFQHRFPFWDMDLLNFFKEVPVAFKENKTLYEDILKNYYFAQYQVNFTKELKPSKKAISFQKLKQQLKPFAPQFVIDKKLAENDVLNYDYMTLLMNESLIKNNIKPLRKVNSLNDRIIDWYLNFSKGKILK